MNLDLSALGLLGVAGMVGLGVKLLLNRLTDVEKTLNRHGEKLVRIETKLGIPDFNGRGAND
jgi:hypothetical protein